MFDATGGCCRKIKRQANKMNGSIFLYEGIMNLNTKSFTILSMLSEQDDKISITV